MEVAQDVERRIVTILFADLVGFTTLSEQFDAEDVAAIQDRYFGTVRETVGRYGGTLEKFIGDAAMAVFGVPRSRDDDAARAVRAGLALTHATEQIGVELGLEPDALRLRVGINTGEAVIAAGGEDSGRVTGDTVNTAARLQTAAPAGRVLIGETTALAVADTAELEPATALELKGKAEPVAARLVIGWRQEPSRDEAMGALRAPTLGREAELAALVDAFARTAEAETVERWLIVAPPGVGKSRLLRELTARLHANALLPLVWRTRTRPDAVAPFEAIAVLMRAALDATDDAAARQTLVTTLDASGVPRMRAEVVVDACLNVAYPRVTAAQADAPPAEERDALFATWLEGMDALAAGRPQVWLVEDVHWAGGDVLAFLDRAAARSPARGGRRLIVATARPSLLEANAAWTADSPDGSRRLLSLATLAPVDAHELVHALVGDALPADLVDRIVERSDGNPLFIEELLRTWVSVGTLVRDGSAAAAGWRLSLAAADIALPASVQSIYAAQLDDLPADARTLARRASVAGRRFPVGALVPLGAAAEAGLGPLQRRELVVGPTTEPVVGTAYSYRHALLRDAGYASLARAERARLHVRLARWLEGAAGERAPEVAEQIAGHYAAALESAPALAREIDGLDRDAVRRLAADWYERAGQGTLALSAHDAARQLLRRSLDLTPDDQRLEQARRWERLGDATAFAMDMDEGAAAYRKAMELYRSAISSITRGFDKGADALGGAADELFQRLAQLPGMTDEGRAGLERGAREMRAGADELRSAGAELGEALGLARAGLARSTSALANVMYQQIQFADAERLSDDVLRELGGDADPASTARLLIARATSARGAHGPSSAQEEDLTRALALAQQAGDPRVELRARQMLTALHSEQGQDDANEWRRLEKAAADVGDWGASVSAAINAVGALVDDHAADAFQPIARVREVALAHGLTDDVCWADYSEAEAAFVSGDWARAIAAGLRGADLGEANAYLRVTVRIWHVLTPIASVRGEKSLLERIARWYAGLEGKFEFPDSLYARIMRPAQDVMLAAAGLRGGYMPDFESRLEAFAREPYGPSYCAAIDRLFCAWLDAGEIVGAGTALDGMAAAVPGYPKPTSLTLGTYELLTGRLAHARGEHELAAKAGRAALDRFRVSDAPWWMAKAIRLLERAGAADDTLLAEVREIERHLGSAGPTA